MGFAAAEPLELPILQQAKKLGLQRQAELADLVEKQRPLVGELDPAGFAGGGARKGALLVPEQLAFQQGLRQRRAVDLDERRTRRALRS